MQGERTATRMMVFLSEDDRHAHKGLHEELLARARKSGIAGATVWRGIEGFGHSRSIRTSRFPDAMTGLPIAVELIDQESAITSFLSVVSELAPGSLVTTEEVHTMRLHEEAEQE